MRNWRILAGFGAFGFVVSLVTAGVSGVDFVNALVRAVIWAIVFFGLGYAILKAVEHFLPELADLFQGKTEEADSAGVDITVPEENPHLNGEEQGDQAPDSASGEPALGEPDLAGVDEAEEVEELEAENEENAGSGPAEAGDVESEPKEAEPADKTGGAEKEQPAADPDSMVEEVEEQIQPAASGRPEPGDGGPEDTSEAAEVDRLPDLDSMSGSFSDEGFSSGSTSEQSSTKDLKQETASIMGSEHDPQEIARAVQTVLQKEEKG
ncbi:MAG: hypothetical protein K9L68_03250 [Spirochaetales bacterium]|nr:hypothetical protein [Spirochaetales bacterium]MCF7937594.1 hypothetical protein [Spirochaetales bacterium]